MLSGQWPRWLAELLTPEGCPWHRTGGIPEGWVDYGFFWMRMYSNNPCSQELTEWSNTKLYTRRFIALDQLLGIKHISIMLRPLAAQLQAARWNARVLRRSSQSSISQMCLWCKVRSILQKHSIRFWKLGVHFWKLSNPLEFGLLLSMDEHE